MVLADGQVCWEAGQKQGDNWRWDKSPRVTALGFFCSLWHFLDSEGLILGFSSSSCIHLISASLLFQRKRAEPYNQHQGRGCSAPAAPVRGWAVAVPLPRLCCTSIINGGKRNKVDFADCRCCMCVCLVRVSPAVTAPSRACPFKRRPPPDTWCARRHGAGGGKRQWRRHVTRGARRPPRSPPQRAGGSAVPAPPCPGGAGRSRERSGRSEERSGRSSWCRYGPGRAAAAPRVTCAAPRAPFGGGGGISVGIVLAGERGQRTAPPLPLAGGLAPPVPIGW